MQVLITSDIAPDWSDLPSDLVIRVCEPEPDAIDAALAGAEILVSEVLPRRGDSAELRWVQLLSAGADQLIGHPILERPLLFANAAGVNAVHIAEYIIGRVLYHFKEFKQFDQLQRDRCWPRDRISLARPSLRDLRALIIGYGGIGRETARLLSSLGVHTSAVAASAGRRLYRGYLPYDGIGDPLALLPEQVVAPSDMAALLPEAHIVVLATPLLPTTYHMADAPMLRAMRPDAILINVGRGALIDTGALLSALDAGHVAHAYLDVFEQEPLPESSPLWQHPRVSLTPHISGTMPDHNAKLRALFLTNLERYRSGRTLLNQLDRGNFS
jgi:phosphoglycerate dehydrogenase-like enzyme